MRSLVLVLSGQPQASTVICLTLSPPPVLDLEPAMVCRPLHNFNVPHGDWVSRGTALSFRDRAQVAAAKSEHAQYWSTVGSRRALQRLLIFAKLASILLSLRGASRQGSQWTRRAWQSTVPGLSHPLVE